MIRISGLQKNFGKTCALDHLSLDIKSGDMVGVIGPNGAGKTTLFKSMTGLVLPDEGLIEIGAYRMPEERREALGIIGAVIEIPHFYDHLSGMDNLRLESIVRGGWDSEWMDRILTIFRLKDYIGDKVKTYSLGMRQRLALCRVLIGRPRILIMDEPTNGLDVEGKICLWKGLKEIRKEFDMTILVSSHSIQEMEQEIGHFYFLKNGKVVSQVTKRDILGFKLVCIKRENAEEVMLSFRDYFLEQKDSGDILLKLSKKQLEELGRNRNIEIMERQWQLLDEYLFVMQDGEIGWDI